jgi:multidrug resistance efflux pump
VNKSNLVLPVVAAGMLAFAVVSVLRAEESRPDVTPLAPPPTSGFTARVGAAGLVEPSSELIGVSAETAGVVAEVQATAGADVRRGDALFRVDDRAALADVAVRRSRLDAARARLAAAEARLVAATARERRIADAPRAEEVPPAEARVDAARALLADARIRQEIVARVSDPRAVTEEDRLRRAAAVDLATAELRRAEAELALVRAGAWTRDRDVAAAETATAAADVATSRADVAEAEASVAQAEVDLDRLVVRAPADGTVLRVNVRAGEFAPAGRLDEPLVVLGSVRPLHVRADVDEADAWRVRPGARATASVKGRADLRAPIEFVRIEPQVLPKRSLTGNVSERVDTRVLQVIYRLAPDALPVHVGQQVDVFLEAPASDEPVVAGAPEGTR